MNLYVYLGIVLVVILVFVFFNSPKGKGLVGEFFVSLRLGHDKQFVKRKIDNFIFKINDRTIQIDHIIINKHGVYVIETKNYNGRLYGDEKDVYWTQVFNYGKSKFKIYNPIKQNEGHIYNLKILLNKFKVPFFSIIVLCNCSEQHIKSYTPVVQTMDLRKTIKRTMTEELISPNEVEEIYNFLMNYKLNNVISLREHVKNVKKRLKNEQNKCPYCGSDLVERQGKYGEFIGCSNYPQCKYISKNR